MPSLDRHSLQRHGLLQAVARYHHRAPCVGYIDTNQFSAHTDTHLFCRPPHRTPVRVSALPRDPAHAEIAKLQQNIHAPGDRPDDEPEDERELRELTQTQLALKRRLANRLHGAQERHGRLVGLLKTLWLHVSDLRAQSAQQSMESDTVSGKIRALCEDIDRQITASQEAERIVASGSGGVNNG